MALAQRVTQSVISRLICSGLRRPRARYILILVSLYQGGVELVPLLDRRRYPSAPDDPLSPAPGPRARAHLPTTDVTNATKVKEEVK